MTDNRVVITGLGVLAPNAHGLDAFEIALREGRSGIKHSALLRDLNFSCQVVGQPENVDNLKQQYFTQSSLLAMNSSMTFAAIAALDCWRDAGLEVIDPAEGVVDWDTGAIVGTGVGGVDTIGGQVTPFTNEGKVKRLGSTMVEQSMSSAVSANIGGLLGLGGQVTTNSSACSTGTEAIVNAFWIIKEGRAKRMLAGSSEGVSQYTWATFDAMRVLARGFNDTPTQASRPMSASAKGFVPGSGAGMLMLESLDSALERGAKIYAEIIGVHVNCGGQRNGGSISAPNPYGVVRCIQKTLAMAQITYKDIDMINGHLTATMADPLELKNWQQALLCKAHELPFINSTKSLIGHALGAAGSIESVACVLQLYKGFIHGSINCEDLHQDLEPFAERIVHCTRDMNMKVLAKASFGFGDVNACLLLRKWES